MNYWCCECRFPRLCCFCHFLQRTHSGIMSHISLTWLVSILQNWLHVILFFVFFVVVVVVRECLYSLPHSVSVWCVSGILIPISLFQCRQQEWLAWLAHAPPPLPASPPWTAVAAATTSTACWRAALLGPSTAKLGPRPWRSRVKPQPTPALSCSNLCALFLSCLSSCSYAT